MKSNHLWRYSVARSMGLVSFAFIATHLLAQSSGTLFDDLIFEDGENDFTEIENKAKQPSQSSTEQDDESRIQAELNLIYETERKIQAEKERQEKLTLQDRQKAHERQESQSQKERRRARIQMEKDKSLPTIDSEDVQWRGLE